VFLEFEYYAVIGSYAFEHAVAVKKPMIINGNLGFGFRIKLAIDID
jgi:hypothetical protein